MLHYSRAPIDEAIIDLHARFGNEPTIGDLEAFAKRWKSDFPLTHRINQVSLEFASAIEGAASSSTATSPTGIRMADAANQHVLQLRLNGFSFSRLRQYTSWPEFLAEMRPRWEEFSVAMGVEQVVRMAIRTINRIEIPQGADLAEYIRLTPTFLEQAHNQVVGYFMQVVLAQADIHQSAQVIVNTGIQAGPASSTMNVLLDVDLFRSDDLPSGGESFWAALEVMHQRKNEIFEAAITDRVRELIK